MQYKGLIFDFDYTLADATQGIVQCFHHAFDVMNIPRAPKSEICRYIGMTLEEMYLRLTGDESSENATLFTKLYLDKAPSIMTPNTVLFPNVIELFEALHNNGYLIGIVTTKRRQRIIETMTEYKLLHTIKLIIGGDNVTKHKPDPEGTLLALEQMGVHASEVLYVGDSLVDAKTAQAANTPFLAVTTGTTTKDEFTTYSPVAVIEVIINVLDYI